jgi:hypothetical protein
MNPCANTFEIKLVKKLDFAPLATDGSNWLKWSRTLQRKITAKEWTQFLELGYTVPMDPRPQGSLSTFPARTTSDDPVVLAAIENWRKDASRCACCLTYISDHLSPEWQTIYAHEQNPSALYESLHAALGVKSTHHAAEVEHRWGLLSFAGYSSATAWNTAVRTVVSSHTR